MIFGTTNQMQWFDLLCIWICKTLMKRQPQWEKRVLKVTMASSPKRYLKNILTKINLTIIGFCNILIVGFCSF